MSRPAVPPRLKFLYHILSWLKETCPIYDGLKRRPIFKQLKKNNIGNGSVNV